MWREGVDGAGSERRGTPPHLHLRLDHVLASS